MINYKNLKTRLINELSTRDAGDQFIYLFIINALKNRDDALKFMTSSYGGYTLSEARKIRYQHEYINKKLNTSTNNRESI